MRLTIFLNLTCQIDETDDCQLISNLSDVSSAMLIIQSFFFFSNKNYIAGSATNVLSAFRLRRVAFPGKDRRSIIGALILSCHCVIISPVDIRDGTFSRLWIRPITVRASALVRRNACCSDNGSQFLKCHYLQNDVVTPRTRRRCSSLSLLFQSSSCVSVHSCARASLYRSCRVEDHLVIHSWQERTARDTRCT